MNRMKQLRERMNKTKAQVARELHMPYTTYVNYEKEAREPNSENLIQIANYFNVSVDYLIGRSDDEETARSTNADQELQEYLANWFSTYDMSSWNGEFFDIDDGLRLKPEYGEEDENGCFPVVGYSII